MASSDDERAIVTQPAHYFEIQGKSLSERISQIKLSEEAEAEIARDTTVKLIRDKALGIFKLGQFVHAALTWNEDIPKKFQSAKRDILFTQYFELNERNEAAVRQLESLLTDPQGNTLFKKIIRILDDSPPDLDLTAHLAAALAHIAASRFRDLFEQHRYALSQIEQLTPQALTILADHPNWPTMNLSMVKSFGTRVTNDWHAEFSQAYVTSKGINDRSVATRVEHSVVALIKGRFIEAHLLGGGRGARCVATDVGLQLIGYLAQSGD